MTWLTEDPTPIYVVAGMAAAVFVALVYFTGRAVWLLGVVVALGIMGAVLLIDVLVITDRERIEDVIAQGAEAVKSNDINHVLPLISPNAPELQDLARRTMQMFKFADVRVTSTPDIVVNKLTSPPSAKANFSAVAHVRMPTSGTSTQPVPRRVELRFAWEGDRWLVTHADWSSIIGGGGDDDGNP